MLVAGGGIGGLATALALARGGLRSEVLERRPDPAISHDENGAGVQIGPNGTRILAALGVDGLLQPHVGVPEAIDLRDARDGGRLARLPLGAWIAARHGAPYWTAHRADLHAALLGAARAQALVTLRFGTAVARVTGSDRRVLVTTDSGETYTGRVLVGADGLWSNVRAAVLGHVVRPQESPAAIGKGAARAVIAADHAPPALRTRETGVWLAPGAHVVHYPVRGGREIAIVVIYRDARTTTGWEHEVDFARVMDGIGKVDGTLEALLRAAENWRRWSLYRMLPLSRWHSGCIVLLGDAAHPMVPFLAQGAVMALEDAVALATQLAAHDGDDAQALARYETIRRARAERVARASWRNGTIYQLDGLAAKTRNIALRALSGERIMAGYDWLYGGAPGDALNLSS